MRFAELVNILGAPTKPLLTGGEITQITSDSRQIGPGSVFVALRGTSYDGHNYIESAINRGCLAVVAESSPSNHLPVPCFQVQDSHQALGLLAASFHGLPARNMCLIALTGTNGKTTTSWLLEGILRQAGLYVGVIGTVNYRYRGTDGKLVVRPASLTTPDPISLQGLLREMVDAGVTHVIVEASSHALSQGACQGMKFDVAVFTNLSRDHLDYHQNMEEYFCAKKVVYQVQKTAGTSVIVLDSVGEESDYGHRLAADLDNTHVLTVGFDKECVIRAQQCSRTINGMSWSLLLDGEQYKITSGLTGRYNILNMLSAAGAARALLIETKTISAGLSSVNQVPGRLEKVVLPGLSEKESPAVFVDYAHTPDGLKNVLSTMKPLTEGRLICVFGCGGDRDAGKRARMGEVAASIADVVLLTSDNPRTEDPLDIIAQTALGLRQAGMPEQSLEELFSRNNPQDGFLIQEDRAAAIRDACTLALPRDVVLIAGKGHEQYQILGQKIFFDDRMQAKNGLAAWTVQHLIQATNGECINNTDSSIHLLNTVSTDTRSLQSGDIFVALRGKNFDGHTFIDQAIDSGAGALIVEDIVDIRESTVPVIRVENSLRALGDLACYRRRLFGDSVMVIGLTGSSGKTTVKEMTASICNKFYNKSDPVTDTVLKTRGNFNNLIGLPLTLLRLEAQHKVAILEMGMNQPGEIGRLTEIAGPDIGCINNIQAAHLEGLGTIEGVAAAKGELFAGLGPEAVLVVNYDDPLVVRECRGHKGSKVGYAISRSGRRRAPEIRVTRIVSLGEEGCRITLHVEARKERFILPAPGIHNVANAAAAAAIAHAAGIDAGSIVAGLAGFANIDKRMELAQVPGGLRVVNDSYNANPSSMAAALQTMATFSPGSRRIAALGDMLELGVEACSSHREIGRLAAELGYDLLAVTGEYRQEVVRGARDAGMGKEQVMGFVDTVAMADWLYHLMISGRLGEEDWLLIKGSRGMRMERLLEELQNRFDPSRNRG